MLRSESFHLGFRHGVLGLDSLVTDYRPKFCAATNAIKGTGTGAVVVKTQLYGMEVEHRNKQNNKCCKANIISEALASEVRDYSSNHSNFGRPFLAEVHLDITYCDQIDDSFLKRRRTV